jgi:photosystem II stability/assembly factor-like uncharacterized protein
LPVRGFSIRLIASSFVLTLVSLASPASALPSTGSSVLPPGFRAQSISWTSPDHGWILGGAPCGVVLCSTVLVTTDGGQVWDQVGTIDAPISFEKGSGVTEIRFADDLNGWALEPGFYATTDGGATWQRETPPGGSHVVLGLAADAETVYALVSPCRLNRSCNTPAQLWHTTPGDGTWTQVSVALPSSQSLGSAMLTVHGVVGYLGMPSCLVYCQNNADVFDATVDGQTWTSRPDPCVPNAGEYLAGLVAVTDTEVAMLCESEPGFGKADKRALRSNDNGQTTSPAGIPPIDGIVSQMAATPDGTLFVSSFGVESFIYRNDGGQTWTTPEVNNDAGQGWNDIVMTSDLAGYVVHGPAACCAGHGPGDLWVTADGGLTWAPMSS